MRKRLGFFALHQNLIMIVVGLFVALFPFLFINQYVLRMGTVSLMYIMLALSMNLIMGYMGQMSFGHAAFWGIGAYTGAIMATRFGTGTLINFLAAAIVCGILGFILGLPTLKLKGFYLTIVTMGFCEIVRLIELNWTPVTNGAMGIRNIPPFKFFGVELDSYIAAFYVIFTLVLLTIFISRRLVNSRYGLALKSIRDDDSAAEAMGVNVVHYKITTFVISAMLSGVAGAFYAPYITYIDSTLFTTQVSQEICVMVIFGGLGSMPGTILGALVLTVIPELMRSLAEYRMLIYGVIMVLMMLVRPQGIMGYLDFGQMKEQLISLNDGLKTKGSERRMKRGKTGA